MEDRGAYLNELIPPPLSKELYNNRFMSIGDSIFMATMKLSELSTVPGQDNTYELNFEKVGVEFVKSLFGKDAHKDIFASHGFICEYPIPCNIKKDFEFRVKGVIWNQYHYPIWDPIDVKTEEELMEKCPTTLQLFNHIYGEDYLIHGLDTMTVEFMFPTHPLPVQIYLSRENNTGKSTMLFYKKYVYGSNATILDNNSFSDKFNAQMGGKVFIGIDEGKLKGEDAVDRMKNLVTTPILQVRAMHKAYSEVPNYSKWALATNNEDFAMLDAEDSRFWVNKVPVMTHEYDPDFKLKLKKEIPYWLGFLKHRWDNRLKQGQKGLMKMHTPKPMSRLWLQESDYSTEALMKLKRSGLPINTKLILSAMINWFEEYNGVYYEDSQKSRRVFTVFSNRAQIKLSFFEKNAKLNDNDILKTLEKHLGFETHKNTNGGDDVRYLNYFELSIFEGNVNNPLKISRRNVYKFNYFDLVYRRDGIRLTEDDLFTDGKPRKQPKQLNNGL